MGYRNPVWGALIFLTIHLSEGAKVTHVDPRIGSLNGASRLTIYGNGFADDMFNYGQGKEKKGNIVELVSQTQSYPCDVHKDGCSETQIMCYTRPMPPDTYYVRVWVDGKKLSDADLCRNNPFSHLCSFRTHNHRTPKVDTITPASGPPGTLVKMSGTLFTSIYGSHEEKSTNGKTVRILRVYMAGQKCELRKPDSDEHYDLKLYNDGTSDRGDMTCKMQGSYIGNTNGSFIIETYGRSQPQLVTLRVTGQNKIAMFQTYAEIVNVVPSTGSVEGGTRVTIHGRNFDETSTKAQVEIGDTACDVKELKQTYIICETKPKPQVKLPAFPGNRGWLREMWNDTSKYKEPFSAMVNFTSPDLSDVIDETKWTDTSDDQYVTRHTGFYVPPLNNEYQFFIRADDQAELWFSNTDDPAEAKKIAECTSHCRSYYHRSGQMSSRMTLKGGKRYYIEVRHREHSGNAIVRVAVKMYKTVYRSTQSGMVKNEIQVLKTTSDVVDEKQTITLNKWKKQSAVREVQEVTVTYQDASSANFRLGLYGVYTVPLPADSPGSHVKTELNKLPVIIPESVDVFSSSFNGGMKYVVTFKSERGDWPMLQGIGNNSQTAFRERTKGKTSMKYFVLDFQGVPAPPLYSTARTKDVKSALDELFGVRCPVEITSPSARKFYQDFETSSSYAESGIRTSEVEPFCGRTSSKNPWFLFQENRAAREISAIRYPKLCFAYYGSLQPKLRFNYSCDEAGKVNMYTDDLKVPIPATTSWGYTCVDMTIVLNARRPSATSFKVYRIHLHKTNHFDDVYIDSIFIGSKVPTTDVEGMVKYRRLRPAAWVAEKVTVESNEDKKFNVTIKTIDCMSNLPLFKVKHASTVSSNSKRAAYGGSQWPSGAQVQVDRIHAASPPVGGTFGLTFNGNTVSGIPADIEEDDLKSQLETLKDIGIMTVTRRGSCASYQWTVEWNTKTGDQPTLVLDKRRLTGVNIDMTVHVAQDGGVFFDPIAGDMLRTVHKEPQVFAKINQIPTLCAGKCSFQWTTQATPTVTDSSPASGSKQSGARLTILGTGFNTDISKNTVLIGGEPCTVVTATPTRLTCDVGRGPAGTYDVTVNVADKGLAQHTNITRQFTYLFAIDGASPTTGGLAGGTDLVISGTGFGPNVTVQVGGKPCGVSSANYSQIICKTPATVTDATVDVTVEDGSNKATSPDKFAYKASLTPIITSLSSNKGTVAGGARIQISGSGFGSSASGHNAVMIGKTPALITSYSNTAVDVTLPALGPGSYPLLLQVGDNGYADRAKNNIPNIDYKLKVTNVHPRRGSMVGGTLVTLTGTGFSTNSSQNIVKFGATDCHVTSATSSRLICHMSNAGKVHKVTNQGDHPAYGKGYAWDHSTLQIEIGDTVEWQWTTPDDIKDVGYLVQQTKNATATSYDGTGFSSGSTKTANGRYVFQFAKPGQYFYWSSPVSQSIPIILRGVVKVQDKPSFSENLTLTIGKHEATYTTSSGVSNPTDSSSCKGTTSTISGCSDTQPSASDASKFDFAFFTCSTPTVTSISPNQGASTDKITIKGNGFSGTKCQNEVTIGGKPCVVSAASSTTIVCNVDPQDSLPVGIPNAVEVRLNNRGYALSKLPNDLKKRFVLLPHVSSVSPNKGSTAGGTLITITGSGFSGGPSATTVSIGGSICALKTITYTKIICLTSQSWAGVTTVTVAVNTNGVDVNSKCSGKCNFDYANWKTPQVTATSPATISSSNSQLKISGSRFGTVASDVLVTIGDAPCTVTSVKNAEITCTVGDVVVGAQPFSVSVTGSGSALMSSPTIAVDPQITSISPTKGSVHGHTLLTINGHGFKDGTTNVKLGSGDCTVKSVSANQIKCTTPPGSGLVKVAVESNKVKYPAVDYTYTAGSSPQVTLVTPMSGKTGDAIQISGSGFGTDKNDVIVSVSQAVCQVTSVIDTTISCNLGAQSAGTYNLNVDVGAKGRAISSVQFTYTLAVSAVIPSQGSFGGGQTLTIQGTGFDATKTNVTVCSTICPLLGQPSPTELTCEVPARPGSGGFLPPSLPCDVTVNVGQSQVIQPNQYTYVASKTATITGVTPKRGGTGGGTKVTIDGTRFSTNNNQLNITIAGTTCAVHSATPTQIVCITGAHKPAIETKVRVENGDEGMAVQTNADFQYIDLWSSKFSWGGGPLPVAGDFVVVPKDMTLLLDTDTPVLKMLLIQGGKVIFDERNVELQTENILITNGGTLQVGTENKPFQHKAIITLHGHLRSQELPIYGTKTLAVREGTLDLHGKPVGITWTKLGATATAGANQITLETPVSWQAGDQIVIATTNHRHSQKENEMHEIASVSSNGLTLTLKSTLKYKHLGETVALGSGKTLEARAEVGLLTHNVVVRGSNHVQWNDKIEACPEGFDTGEFAVQTCFQGRFGEEMGTDQFGSQIMLHAPRPNEGLVVGRISNIEVTHAGQAFRLGRYAIHFHLNGDMGFSSYVRSSSIHKSFNRAVNVHGTHRVLLEHNVLYNIMGGAMFLEDGIETGNIFQYNLAVFVKSSTSLLNDDITPAAFWVTNPNNTVRHNHAAGGTHFGFWYRMHNHPDGPSFDRNVCPRKVPLGEFRNNTVHSQGWFGIWIFQHFYPMKGGCCSCTDPEAAKFYSLTAWNNEKGAEWVGGGSLQFHNCMMVNNEKAGIEMKLVSTPERYNTNGARIVDTTIAAKPSTPGIMYPSTTNAALVLPFGYGLSISGVTFMNFNDKGKAGLSFASIQGTTGSFNGGFRYEIERSTFINSPNKIRFRWENEAVIHDLDGTFTGITDGKVVPYSPSLPPSKCTQKAEYSVGYSGSECQGSVGFHRFSFNQPSPSSLLYKDVNFTNVYGTAVSPYQKKRFTHPKGWMVLLVSAEQYTMVWPEAYQLTNISYDGLFYEFKASDHLIVAHNFTQKPDFFTIEPGIERNESTNILSAVNSFNGDWYFDDQEKMLTYIISGKSRSKRSTPRTDKDRHVKLKVYRCRYTNCLPPPDPNNIPPSDSRPSNYSTWSNPSTWYTMDQTVPKDGEDWTIPSGVWMVVDQNTLPKFNKIIIYGVLELEYQPDPKTGQYRDFTVSATHIFISGGRFIVGWEKNPFQGQAQIILRGDHFSPDMPLHDGPNVGAKAIGVFGGLDLHGKPRQVTWTQLSQTAAAGSNSLTLEKAVDWAVGEEIMITGTSYSAWHTETFKISAVSSDRRTITLDSNLKYNHIAVSENLGGGRQIRMAAEVALLTRNVKIIGNDYPKLEKESFGARVLVSTYSDGFKDWIGYARISNVEFYHTGQEGWTDFYDPRYSLAFLDAGNVGTVKPSYVRSNTFHHGFASAIGVYGTNGLEIDDNVIYRTVGSSIIVWGDRVKLRRNLVSLVIFTGSYRGRFETFNVNWYANFEIFKATNAVLQGNRASGSERSGFHTSGEPCSGVTNPADAWYDNVAHSTLIGVYTETPGGKSGCMLISNFTSYKSWDFGFYHQTASSQKYKNIVSVDNTLGLFPFVLGPSATGHAFADKFVEVSDSYFVGTSSAFDCTNDKMDSSDKNIELSNLGRSWRSSTGGKVGMSFSTFSSGGNSQPTKPFKNIKKYQAINGRTTVSGVTFANFGTSCGTKKDVAVTTNPNNDDGIHPMYTNQITLSNVDTANKIYLHRPRLGQINPSDCVDMDCDGLKKAILNDQDGTFLGGSKGSIIPESEWEWDGDPRRGLGDYRIPKVMLTKLNGDRIPVKDIAPNKGIIRDSTCTYKSSYQAYECHGLDYEMLMLESLDSDTETRRVSPVAVLGDGYVDLINGPQDHGWCMGYTCQKRLSTFPIILALGKTYDIFYTGTSPQKTRLHLLNTNNQQAVVVGIFYSDARRFDVYHQDKYIVPTNAYYNAKGQQLRRAPTTKGQYMPNVNSDSTGTNYFDRDYNMLYVLVRGKIPVDIRMTQLVVVSFEMPPLTIDEFFGQNLVTNIALLLEIPENKIKIASAVKASRRRRAIGNTKVTVEIGDDPMNGTNVTDPTALTSSQLQNASWTLINAFQTQTINSHLNNTIISLSIVEALPSPGSEAWKTMTKNGAPVKAQNVIIPQNMKIHTQPVPQHEGVEFSTQPLIHMVDQNGNVVTQLGSRDQSWQLTATLRVGSGTDNRAQLTGNATVTFQNGWANFTDLSISHSGNGYIIDFAITSPSQGVSSFTVSASGLTVANRPLSARIVSQPYSVSENAQFNMQLEIVDALSGAKVDDVGWKGHSWTCLPSLHIPSIYSGSLSGITTAPVSRIGGTATLSNMALSQRNRYFVSVRCVTNPAAYDFTVVSDGIDVTPVGYVAPTVEKSSAVTLVFDADFDSVVKGKEKYFAAAVINHLMTLHPNVTYANPSAIKGSIRAMFTIQGPTTVVQDTLLAIWGEVKKPLTLTFDGTTVKASYQMMVDGAPYWGNDQPPTLARTGLETGAIVAIVLVAVVLVALIVGFLVWRKLYAGKAASEGKSTNVLMVHMEQQDFLYTTEGEQDMEATAKRAGGSSLVVPNVAPGNTVYPGRPTSSQWRLRTPKHRPMGRLSPLPNKMRATVSPTIDIRPPKMEALYD